MKELYFESLDSTNQYIKDNYDSLDDFSFVSCGIQTNGYGRNKRSWDGGKGNLMFSLLVKDKEYFPLYKEISIISAYSVLQVLKEYGIINVSIKWPNDVYAGDEKICGILLEAISKQELQCLIIGIGVNVNQKEFIDYDVKATSLCKLLNKEIDLDKFRSDVYKNLLDNLNKLKDHYNFLDEIKKYDYLKNKNAYALINNSKQYIKVLGINDDYSLRIKLNERELNIEAGEISFHI